MIFTFYNGLTPYYKKTYFLIFYIFSCSSFINAYATPRHNSIEEDLFKDIPVVLSVTRLEQPVTHAPAAVTIIDRDMIEASGARTIPELLRHVPGFYVGYDENDLPVTTYHGFAEIYARRIQILVDGRSVYQPSFFGVTWADLPLIIEDIDRIEVIRTPNTASYGANAFLATISIHTKKPPENKQTYFKTLYGKYDERRFVAKYGDQQGNLNYRLSLAFEKDDLYGHIESLPENERRFDRRRFTTLTANSTYRATTNDQIIANFGVLKGVSGEGNFSGPSAYAEIYDARVLSHYEQLKWEHKIAADNDISIQLYHNSHDRDDNYIELTDLNYPGPLNQDIKTERYDVELVHRFAPFTNTRMVWGVNSRWDEVDSIHFFLSTNPAKYSMRRAFTNIEWQPAHWITSNLGIMHENNSFTGSDTSPRLGINLSINPRHTLRFIHSKATRVPSTIEELADRQYCLDPPACTTYFPDWLGNPNVRAEKIISKEIGYHIIFGNNSSIDLKGYRDTMKDILFYDTSSGRLSFINGDDVEISGFEIETDYRPDSKTRLHLSYADTDIDYKG
ncbi:MAG: TonB-dependent receptor, partial [Gammaproteobacteria bacterium]|nr:TonB-dependent receptor [Gammaproteobacteria bacterium]